jgi:ATP-binding cassette, subfamily C, bacterial
VSSAALARAVVAQGPARAAAALGLLVLASATEGLSVLVFVPALELLQSNAGSGLGDGVLRLAHAAGLAPDFETALAVCAMLVLTRALCLSQRTRVLARLLADFTTAQRTRLFAALANARWSHTRQLRHADLEHALTDDVERVHFAAQALLQLVQGLILIAAYAALSLLVSPVMTLLVGAMGAVLLLVQRPARRAAAALGKRYGEERAELYRALGGFVGELKLAKGHGTEAAHVARFADAAHASRETAVRFAGLAADATATFQVAAAACVGIAVLVGARGVGLGATELLMLIVFVARMVPALAGVQTNLQALRYGLPGYARVDALRRALDAAPDLPAVAEAPFTLAREIELDAVRVRHVPGSGDALALSARIPARALTAVTGATGAGKTTLADVVLGLIEPDSGTLRADGRTIDRVNARAWRRHAAYVPQDPPMFSGSVRANLLLGAPGAQEPAIWHALAQAAADTVVARLPDALDTPVGPGGVLLSGGERQRLALARALLRRPRLLVLDEATSALDAATEARVLATLADLRAHMTILVIAHRPAVLEHADWVIVLDAGELVQQGPPSRPAGARCTAQTTRAGELHAEAAR